MAILPERQAELLEVMKGVAIKQYRFKTLMRYLLIVLFMSATGAYAMGAEVVAVLVLLVAVTLYASLYNLVYSLGTKLLYPKIHNEEERQCFYVIKGSHNSLRILPNPLPDDIR